MLVWIQWEWYLELFNFVFIEYFVFVFVMDYVGEMVKLCEEKGVKVIFLYFFGYGVFGNENVLLQ